MTPAELTDLITAEEVKKLAEDCLLAAKVLADTHTFPTGQAVLTEAARTVTALHAQLADAQAAQAMVVERCAETIAPQDVYGDGRYFRVPGFHQEGCAYKDNDLVTAASIAVERIRALAPIDGLALVRELRDRAEKAEAERDAAREALMNAGVTLHVSKREATEAKADRDRLADANAALEARVAELEGALRNLVGPDCMYDGRNIVITAVSHGDAIRLVADARAALATQEAGNG